MARRVTERGSNSPFSPARLIPDLVNALPAIGMLLGGVVGAALGWLNPEATFVSFGGIGIGAGLLLGIFLRGAFRRD